MSLGSIEFGQQSIYNKYFTNTNMLYVAASGDVSSVPNFPSILSNVLSVGGTTLKCDTNNNRLQEYTWKDAGCSPSKFVLKPIYQNGILAMQQMKTRNTPDISANASPQSGVKIYCNGKWSPIGGTSASCPIVCGILAICCEKRKLLKKLPLTSVMNNKCDIHQILYNLSISKDYSTYFYDVKQGTNSIYQAGIGYDIATGCGVLQADKICNYLTNL
jgi:kumamolisin